MEDGERARRKQAAAWLTAGTVIWCAGFGAARSSSAVAPVSVAVRRLGFNRVSVQASTEIPQSPDVVWRVLTDYDHLHDFIPGLIESRLLSNGPTQLLKQRGAVPWLLLRRSVEVMFEIHEIPKQAIEFHAVSGDFIEHHGAWRLQPQGANTQILYDATIRPDFLIPPVLGEWVLKGQLANSLRAVAKRAQATSAATVSTTP